jgi:hypothetical protein
MEFTDSKQGEDLRLEFEGIHFLEKGTIYGFAAPTGYVYLPELFHIKDIDGRDSSVNISTSDFYHPLYQMTSGTT